jgi:hypothetical protein
MPADSSAAPEIRVRKRHRRRLRRRFRREMAWQLALGALLVAVLLVVLIYLGRNSGRWFTAPPDAGLQQSPER